MLRVLAILSVVMLGGAGSPPSAAAAAPPRDQQEQPAAFDADKLMPTYYDHLIHKRFEGAEKVIAAFRTKAPDRVRGEALATLLQSPVAAGRRKDADARRLLSEGEAALGNAPEAMTILLPAYLILERKDFAGLIIDKLLARAPDVVRELPADWVVTLLRDTGEPTEALDTRRIALAEIGFGGNEGDYFTADAIGILMKRGDTARAASLVRYVDAPRVVENLLIQRRFSPLWPALAAQAGPKLANSRSSVVRLALRDHQEQPDDPEKLANLISAYRFARQPAEALALREKLPATAAEMAKANEQTAWAVNNLALVLHEAGRAEDADRLFASLNEALPKNDWRVSMFINRAELLVSDGKFAAALPVIALAEKESKSPYAEQLLRRLRYCALTRLDRKNEAAALRPDVLANAKSARGPTIDGLICSGELDEAERLAIAHIDDEDFQEEFVRSLQHKRLTSDDPSIWGGWTALRQRPAIAAAFERLGRDLPEDLRAVSTN